MEDKSLACFLFGVVCVSFFEQPEGIPVLIRVFVLFALLSSLFACSTDKSVQVVRPDLGLQQMMNDHPDLFQQEIDRFLAQLGTGTCPEPMSERDKDLAFNLMDPRRWPVWLISQERFAQLALPGYLLVPGVNAGQITFQLLVTDADGEIKLKFDYYPDTREVSCMEFLGYREET